MSSPQPGVVEQTEFEVSILWLRAAVASASKGTCAHSDRAGGLGEEGRKTEGGGEKERETDVKGGRAIEKGGGGGEEESRRRGGDQGRGSSDQGGGQGEEVRGWVGAATEREDESGVLLDEEVGAQRGEGWEEEKGVLLDVGTVQQLLKMTADSSEREMWSVLAKVQAAIHDREGHAGDE